MTLSQLIAKLSELQEKGATGQEVVCCWIPLETEDEQYVSVEYVELVEPGPEGMVNIAI